MARGCCCACCCCWGPSAEGGPAGPAAEGAAQAQQQALTPLIDIVSSVPACQMNACPDAGHHAPTKHSSAWQCAETRCSSSTWAVGAPRMEVGLPDADGAVLRAAGVCRAPRRKAHAVHRAVMPCSTPQMSSLMHKQMPQHSWEHDHGLHACSCLRQPASQCGRMLNTSMQKQCNPKLSRTFVDVQLVAGVVVVQVHPHVVAARRPALALCAVAGALHGVGRLQHRGP